MIFDDLESFFNYLVQNPGEHSCEGKVYGELKEYADKFIKPLFGSASRRSVNFGDFGEICFPFIRLGQITSLNLFDIDELIVFAFYLKSKNKYQFALDLGANLGLHSLLMSRVGWFVISLEPEPKHFQYLKMNLEENLVNTVSPMQYAAYDQTEGLKFLTVHGNTTGSHISGMKPSPYGGHTEHEVNGVDISRFAAFPDLVKLDIEGSEGKVLPRLLGATDRGVDVMGEIGNDETGLVIWNYCQKSGYKIYSQRTKWRECASIFDLPRTYKEGSVFMSRHNTPF